MNFTIYSKHGCPYCDKIKSILYTYKLDHTEFILDTHFTRTEFIEKFGAGSTFPQVYLNDIHLGGCVDSVKYLRENKII